MWPLYLPLVIPALAGAAARPVAARLEPRQATWLLTSGGRGAGRVQHGRAGLLAAYAAARAPVLAAAGGLLPAGLRRGDPISAAVGAAAALALAGAAVAVAVIFRNRARALAESYRRAAGLHANDGIVVVPGPAIEAYALPGWPGRIVVSRRLLDRLDSRGQAALIAHEQAHLAGRHHLFAAVARLAAAANPLLLPVARSVEYTVERWADERAAAVTGDRRLVAETIGQVALLAGPRRRRTAGISLGITGARPRRVSVAWAGPVPRRVAALLTPPPRRRIILLVAAAVDRPDRRGSRPGGGQGPARPARTRPGRRVTTAALMSSLHGDVTVPHLRGRTDPETRAGSPQPARAPDQAAGHEPPPPTATLTPSPAGAPVPLDTAALPTRRRLRCGPASAAATPWQSLISGQARPSWTSAPAAASTSCSQPGESALLAPHMAWTPAPDIARGECDDRKGFLRVGRGRPAGPYHSPGAGDGGL